MYIISSIRTFCTIFRKRKSSIEEEGSIRRRRKKKRAKKLKKAEQKKGLQLKYLYEKMHNLHYLELSPEEEFLALLEQEMAERDDYGEGDIIPKDYLTKQFRRKVSLV